MFRLYPILWLIGLLMYITWAQPASAAVAADPRTFSCNTPEAQILANGVPYVNSGSTTFYIGYQQVSSTNQDPIVARYDNGIRVWCRTDYETSAVNHQGYGIVWDGSGHLYAVFSTEGSITYNQDFSRFTGEGWLEAYGRGTGRAAVITRLDPVTGDVLAATYHSAVLTNGNTNALTVTEITLTPTSSVVVRARSESFPREINGTRMVCTGRPYNYTIEFNEDLTAALGAVSTGCTSVSPLPSTARVPREIVKVAPQSGDFFTENQVMFRWDAAEHAQWYRIYIVDSNGFVIDTWKPTNEVCIGNTCVLSLVLTNGRHDWYITGWGEDGQGPWTTATTFFVGRRPPNVVNRLGPSGSVTDPFTPIQWEEAPDALWYRLYLVGRNNFVVDRWIMKETVCQNGVCALPLTSLFLSNGTYLWWMQPWGEAGLGEWTPSGLEFQLQTPLPTVVEPLNPTQGSTANTGGVVFQWQAEPNTTWYRMYIGRQSDYSMVHDRWYDATEICRSGVCSVSLNVAAGDYIWFIHPWGPGGFGSWNDGADFTVRTIADTQSS
ncbi:MAG: hypothetical protein OHK0046_20550 [Anaerolineae bacterium]